MFHSTFTSVVSTQHLDCGFKNLLLLLLLLLFSKREKNHGNFENCTDFYTSDGIETCFNKDQRTVVTKQKKNTVGPRYFEVPRELEKKFEIGGF